MSVKLITAFFVLAMAAPALALPTQFVQEGFLTNANGAPIGGNVQIRVRLYSAAAGGQPLFDEIHQNIEIVQGYYAITVGSIEALDDAIFEQDRIFLGIRVDDGDELRPRTEMMPVPAAMRASVSQDAIGRINPISVTIAGFGLVIDENGKWIGDPTGLRGPAGPAGVDGVNGVDGAPGAAGPQGEPGPQGVAGPQGQAGGNGSPDTPAQVLAKLVQVDGVDSNVDADLVDGLNASQFMRTDANTSTTGTLTTGGTLTAPQIALDGGSTQVTFAPQGNNQGGGPNTFGIDLQNRNLIGANSFYIADPGPSEGLVWNGSQARVVVSPLDNTNADGFLRLINDEGISLESDVRMTGQLQVAGQLEVGGGLVVPDQSLSGVANLTINDPGPDGFIAWDGTSAKVFVAPMDNSNADGVLRIQNDGGISLEDDLTVSKDVNLGAALNVGGATNLSGTLNLQNRDIDNINGLRFNDAGVDGAVSWKGAAARIYVAPLNDANDQDGFLRIQNDGGISLEDDVRITGTLEMLNGFSLANQAISGLDNITINDPGPDGFLSWAGTQAKIYVAPMNNTNVDGKLRIQNDEGISLEDNVSLPNRNLTGLNELHFNDAGPDGSIVWDGTQARIYVAPDNDANSDGRLQIKNDDGVRVSSPFFVKGTSNLDGNVTLTNKNLVGLNELHFNDPGADGSIKWDGTQAQIYVSPLNNANTDGYLRIINNDGISLEDNVYLPNRNLTGLNELHFNDAGPDGSIVWDGTQARIYVAPDNDANADGRLQIKNDDGVRVSSPFFVKGTSNLDGNVTLTNKNLVGLNELHFNDPGADGSIKWDGTQAQIYVSPLNNANTDGYLRLINNGGISLEDHVYLPNKNLTGLNELHFNDPGADGSIKWDGTQAQIYVSPLNNANTDGYLRIINNDGISLEDNVYLPNKNLTGLNELHFNDAGPDGVIKWSGTAARIYVAPDNDANADGRLQIKNDGGVRVSSDFFVVGSSSLDGNVALTNRNLTGLNELHFNDPGADGSIKWDGTGAQIYVSPLNGANTDGYLRIINDGGGISLEDNVYLPNRNLTGLNELHFNDPGADGAIVWDGTAAKIYVSPLNNGNTDGYLRLINDGGISLESDVRISGNLTVNGKYQFYSGPGNVIHYFPPTGGEYTLDMDSAANNTWKCSAENKVCHRPSSNGDGELQFNLAGSHSIACTLLHWEDDTPGSAKGIYYSTDGGNGCHVFTGQAGCFNMKREGKARHVIDVWRNYAIMCF